MRNISKKGAIEVQFGWIFVLIVGVLILLFFVSVVKTTGKSSAAEKNNDLQVSFKSVVSQSEIDVGTTRTIGLPGITLNFKCFDDNKDSSFSQIFPYKTIFSPDVVKGREILTYSKYFEMPYKADYFIYVTSKDIRYNFINDSNCYSGPNKAMCQSLLNNILKELPVNITYKIWNTVSDVKENNNYKERFIFINSNMNSNSVSLLNLGNSDVTGIKIIPSLTANQMSGSVIYYKNNAGSTTIGSTSYYMGIPMLIGAIISEESLYECNVNKSLQKYKTLTEIYINRTDYLHKYYNLSNSNPGGQWSICYTYYGKIDKSFHTVLSDLKSATPLLKFDDIYKESYILKDGIKETNNDLMIGSCPMIY